MHNVIFPKRDEPKGGVTFLGIALITSPDVLGVISGVMNTPP